MSLVFLDIEVSTSSGKIADLGAVDSQDQTIHTPSQGDFLNFVKDAEYVGGHNVLNHDLQYLKHLDLDKKKVIDTLYLSPLMFPMRPSHKLLKDEKILSDALNNPLLDAQKSRDLFHDEVNAFNALDADLKDIFFNLLKGFREFKYFFEYVGLKEESKGFFNNLLSARSSNKNLVKQIQTRFAGLICENASFESFVTEHPIELAYALSVINLQDKRSITPAWVLRNYPYTENILFMLRNNPCHELTCPYCNGKLDVRKKLKEIFGHDSFRTYDGEPLQEQAASAAVNNDSLLAIFPTGGGKSITFQLPALMAGENYKGLTVVISPLQSLMKDQVDNLSSKGIPDAVTINGLLKPPERAEAIERVASGMASMLYISPESLRSRTIEKLLLSRQIARFVIDEAHCFSSWGHDFRVDYLYIGDFIKKIQEQKFNLRRIPVSCFTATAKQKVVQDICDYFKKKLDLDLKIFATRATRANLTYHVIYQEDEEQKYKTLRSLIETKNCPTIVYVSRTRKTHELAEKLSKDGFAALPFNGKMDSREKVENQEAFIHDKVKIIVATSAFGMGVDKGDVQLVVHFDISDSLENYVQEAGRAGRKPELQAECYVLFNESDLDKHFLLLNQTKLSMSEIQQVWKAIKSLTKNRTVLKRSPLEIAREAGFDDPNGDVETRVKTAILALEDAGYIERKQNCPQVYATGILVKNMEEASSKIAASNMIDETQKEIARRIVSLLISQRSTYKAKGDEAESRIDYIADILGLECSAVQETVQLLRAENILADSRDLTAYIKKGEGENKSKLVVKRFESLENFLISKLKTGKSVFNLKELNEEAENKGIKKASVKDIKTILFFWMINGLIEKNYCSDICTKIELKVSLDDLLNDFRHRIQLAHFIIDQLYQANYDAKTNSREEALIQFSEKELLTAYENQISLFDKIPVSYKDLEKSLLYLSKINSLQIEDGFFVLYNALEIHRIEKSNLIKYKIDDYEKLNNFYQMKMQQIHIVGEYANMMVRDSKQAQVFVSDYFALDYKMFLNKYFKGNRLDEINHNITPQKYHEIVDSLSERQKQIIEDKNSQYIMVAAGPGSGKTRVLVHKLASLMLLEDVKHEQLLMLTFSRSAAIDFKEKLHKLIGNAATFLTAKTFHSYAFDLLGTMGDLDKAGSAVEMAVEKIKEGEIEHSKITKKVLVIDEAQDMDEHQFALVQALIEENEDMRVIAVGDDDQNIFEGVHQKAGSASVDLNRFMDLYKARKYELVENYRSVKKVVDFTNLFVQDIPNRLKMNPIRAVTDGDGAVRVRKFDSPNMEYPIVEHMKKYPAHGTVCVLTQTNDDALKMMALLNHEHIKAKLIQDSDGFSLHDLVEFRSFMKWLSTNEDPVISTEEWKAVVSRFQESYQASSLLSVCLKALEIYQKHNDRLYRNDLKLFLMESKISDFERGEKNEVVVSTIHKAKGREFDRVYIMIKDRRSNSEQGRRVLYVGFTRAKKQLYVFHCCPFLDKYAPVIEEKARFSEPAEIICQFGHKDMWLDYSYGETIDEGENLKKRIFKLYSGNILRYSHGGLYDSSDSKNPVAVLSKKAREKISHLKDLGYSVKNVRIRYVVAWHNKEREELCPIILPEIELRKNHV
ncbi:MAG: RecQ family ATP-dependent DNA helicase [Fibrobacter sp.]|nr:RecQ family ATP-dependent DNA helicase [Fibrobacter sp.]